MSEKVPKDLVMTSLNITYAYGMEELPPLEDIPVYELDFSKEYGFKDLSVESISQVIDDLGNKNNIHKLKEYLAEKLGFQPVDLFQFNKGLNLASSWSLIE